MTMTEYSVTVHCLPS